MAGDIATTIVAPEPIVSKLVWSDHSQELREIMADSQSVTVKALAVAADASLQELTRAVARVIAEHAAYDRLIEQLRGLGCELSDQGDRWVPTEGESPKAETDTPESPRALRSNLKGYQRRRSTPSHQAVKPNHEPQKDVLRE